MISCWHICRDFCRNETDRHVEKTMNIAFLRYAAAQNQIFPIRHLQTKKFML